MLGRCSAITPNEPDFGMNEEEIARYWCQRSGIPWLGRADIGHDTSNKIVPFGPAATYVDRVLKGEKPTAIEDSMSAFGS
jgi:muramoyltetrapeptide carboxypeptidase LdcA involved in peptidoglycan recycling